MQVITDAKELEKHTYIKTRKPAVFPKKERLGLAQRMMNEASDLVADLMEANDLLLTDPEERELRYRAQRSALRNCRKLIHHIELAHEILSGFGDDAFAYWAKMAAGVKNQTAKWYKPIKRGPPSWTRRSVTSEAALGVCLVFSCRLGQQRPQRQHRWHSEQEQRLQRQQRPAPRFDGSPDLLTARDGRRTLCPIIQGRHIPPAAAAV